MYKYIVFSVLYPYTNLKGQCHEIFCCRFFSWITLPQAPDNNIRIISKFFENSRRYPQVKVHHRCQRHRWQICQYICFLYYPKVTKQNYYNFSDWRFFPFATGVVDTGANLELGISPRIFEKIRNGLNGILWGLGETDSWKEPEAKNLVTLSL